MLQKAKFHSFTRIPNDEWKFSQGINIIVGENGLGKTHVLKAIYALLKVQADTKEFTKSVLEKQYADKLISVLRPESLGRLVRRGQKRGRCEISLTLAEVDQNCTISFGPASINKVEIAEGPQVNLRRSPVYFPTRELVTLCPWFVSFYDNFHLEFEETWRDTVSLLGAPLVKGEREKEAARFLHPLEEAMGGKVVVDSNTGRFYLHIADELLEMPLVAEGLRKLAMLARLVSTGTLIGEGYLFWDEPETNLNPKLVRIIARCIVQLAAQGIQVFIATHSLFLLREFEIELDARAKQHEPVPANFFGLHANTTGVSLEQASSLAAIGNIVALEESLGQADRYMDLGE